MNKKGIIKAGIFGVMVLVLIVFVFLSGFGKAQILRKTQFILGESVKVNLAGIESIKIKIVTPSSSYVKEDGGGVFVFKPEELGNYQIILELEGRQEVYEFEVVGEEFNEVEEIEEESDENVEKLEIRVDEEVRWVEIENVSDFTNETRLSIPNQAGNISVYMKTKHGKEKVDARIEEISKLKSVILENVRGEIEVEYYTPPVTKEERKISERKKEVVVKSPEGLHYENVVSYTTIPEITLDKEFIKLYWKEQDREMEFEVFDKDGNGLLDYIEWKIPHLSEQTFEIIIITKAEHLNSSRGFIEDVYEEVRELDGVWSEEIADGEYVRVVFERNLTNKNDITIFPRMVSGSPRIEVYEKDKEGIIAEFASLEDKEYNKVILTNLIGSQDSFDLKIIGGSVEFDYIVDPSSVEEFHESFPNIDASWTGSDDLDTAQDEWWNITQEVGDETSMSITNDLVRQGGSFGAEPSDPYFLKVSECDPNNFGANCHAEARSANGAYFSPSGEGWISGDLSFYWAYYVDVNEGLRLQFWNSTNQVWVTIWTNLSAGQNTFVDWTQQNFSFPSWVFEQTEFSYRLSFDTPGGQDDILIDEVVMNVTRRPPGVSITSPLNLTYSVSSIDFNITLDKSGSAAWYTLDSGITNISMSTTNNLTYNATNSSIADGAYTAKFYANDTFGNLNDSEQVTFGIDTVSPLVTVNNPTIDGINYSVSNVLFNVTLNELGSAVLYTLDSGIINISMSTTNNLTYNATNTTVGDGFYLVTFYANDSVGNRNYSVSRNFGIDTTNPSLSLIEPQVLNYTRNQIDINFTVSDSGVGLDSCWYTLDNGITNNTLISCQNTTPTFPQGTINLKIYANDTLNNVNNTNNVTFFIDSIFPLIEFISPTPLNGSGREDQFLIVNVSVTEINFANITYVLHNDTGQVNLTTYLTLVTTINWTGLSNNFDNYSYNVTIVDILGNINFTETRYLLLTPGDVNPPDIFINIPESEGFAFNVSSVDFDITLSEQGDTALYTLDDGITNITMSSLDNLTYNATNTSIGDGDYTFKVYANDTAGNLGINSRGFTIDTIFPLIDYGLGTESDGVNLSQNFIFVNVTATEINEKLINFTLYDSGTLINATSYTDATRIINWTSLSDGNYVYNVTIIDLAGNVNTTQERSIRLDTSNPGAFLLVPGNGSLVNVRLQNLTVNATDNLGLSNLTLLVFDTLGSLINSTSVNNYQTHAEIGIEFNFPSDGNFTWAYKATDSARNLNITENNTIRVDATIPLINFGIGTEDDNVEREQKFIYVNVSLNEDHFANITYELHNSTSIINSTIYNSEILEINWTNLPSGNITYFYNATVFDAFGNFNSTETRTIKLIDSHVPDVAVINPENTTYTSNESLPIDFNVSDDNLASCWYTLDSGITNITISGCGSTSFSVADEQSYTLRLYANDTLGFTNSSSVTFFVNTSLIFTNTWIVQRGSVSVDGSQPVSIDEVDREKSFVIHTQRSSDSGPDSLFVASSFPLNNQIKFENFVAGAGATVEWEVITGPNLTVSRGIQNFATTDLAVNVTLNSDFNLTSSFLVVSTNLNSGTNTQSQQGKWTGRFINETLIELRRGVSGSDGNVSWQAVEWTGASVQNGSFSASALSGTDTLLNSINENQTFLIFSSTSDSGTGLDFNNIGGFIFDANTLSFYRQDDDAGFMFVEYFVIESELLDVRRGSFSITGAAAVDQSFIELINQSRSFNRISWDSTGSGNTHANAILSAGITNLTNLRATKGTGSQTQNVSWQVIEIEERDSPAVSLLYPVDSFNATGFNVEQFNYSVSDESDIVNCSLFGNWTAVWHMNQSVNNVSKNVENNFSSISVEGDGFYIWNVGCIDAYDNIGFNNTNFTFAAFNLPYTAPNLSNVSQEVNDGTGNVSLYWDSVSNAVSYRVYYNESLSGDFSLLNETGELNFSDNTFNGSIRRFYQIRAWNPTGENTSLTYFGAHVYTLGHSGNTRNWISFPTNASYLNLANDSLTEIRNATAFTMWNATTQKRVTCNSFSCPEFPSCTDTNCNFNLEKGKSYETNINSSAPDMLNWSLVGLVNTPVLILLEKNVTDFGKNWIALPANTSLNNAQSILENITGSDAVSYWDFINQKSVGLIPSPFPFGPAYLGTNFSLVLERGYEVSVNATANWTQS